MFAPAKMPRHRATSPKKPLNLKDLIIFLVKLGFRYYKPLSRTWNMAFVLKKNQEVLCILIRKNGIDLRHYGNYNSEITIVGNTKISMHGGDVYRNHYNESKNLITKKIKVIASSFASGKFHDAIRTEDGKSYSLNPKFQAIKNRSIDRFQQQWERMVDAKNERSIQNYIREDCGGYLGDGEWL
jgi:hypothetical protein